MITTDVQALTIDDKWGATIARSVEAELDALIQQLVGRLHVLADRYESTLHDLDQGVDDLSAKVAGYLVMMGVDG